MQLPNTSVVLIGAGKISYSLADGINKAGMKIVSIISRNKKSAQLLSKKYKIPHFSDNINEIPSSANFFIIAVPDDQIAAVAEKISKLKLNFKECIFIHLSGVETVSVLSTITEKGGAAASFHIMQTFPSKKTVNFRGCYSAIETNNKKAEKLLFVFSKKLKLKPFTINSNVKIFYHLAGVYASNFLVGNFFMAEKLFKKSSETGNFYDVIKPIIETTLKNIKKNKAVKSLSGPVERGDKETILKHLSAFDFLIRQKGNIKETRLMKQNYMSQSLSLIELIKEREGKLTKKYDEVKNILLNHNVM